jgi:hypothetical protein
MNLVVGGSLSRDRVVCDRLHAPFASVGYRQIEPFRQRLLLHAGQARGSGTGESLKFTVGNEYAYACISTRSNDTMMVYLHS